MNQLTTDLLVWVYKGILLKDKKIDTETLKIICKEHNVDIEILQFFSSQSMSGKNCFSYALNLNPIPYNIPPYQWMAPFEEHVMKWIVDGFIKEEEDGNVIGYWDKDQLCHMGLLSNDVVVSKWGKSHLIKHELYSTPYGTEVKRYRIKDHSELVQAWNDIAKSFVSKRMNC